MGSGNYDDYILVKPTKSALEMMPNVDTELPYDGARGMLHVDDVDHKVFLDTLLESTIEAFPARKKKK